MANYTFQKNDLIICKPNGEIPEDVKNFAIYARVVSVDREADTVYLDRYMREGRLHINANKNNTPSKMPLARVENEGYYQPMNDDEVLKFHNGLAKLMASSYQGRKIDNFDVGTTFEVVNEAAERIERERKTTGQRDVEGGNSKGRRPTKDCTPER